MQINIQTIEGEPRAGTYLIAKGFKREHKMITKLIDKYESDFKDFSDLKTRKLKSTGGRAVKEYMLNEYQSVLLFSLLRNSKKSVFVLKELLKQFKKAKELIQTISKAFDSFDFDNIDVKYVYAAQDLNGNLKIGISNNPERRLRELNAGNPDLLKLVYVKEASQQDYKSETQIHNKASKHLIHREWYTKEAMEVLNAN